MPFGYDIIKTPEQVSVVIIMLTGKTVNQVQGANNENTEPSRLLG